MSKTVKKLLIVLLALCLLPVCSCTKNPSPTPSDSLPTKDYISGSDLTSGYVKWEGRYQYIEDGKFGCDQVALFNTATGFTVDFYGTYLKVRFIHFCKSDTSGTDIYYSYALDDETLPIASEDRRFYLPDAETDKVVTITSGLTEGHHSVKCLKQDEPADAYTSVVSFETDGGFYERDEEKDNENKKFMIICASNGSGYGSLYYNPDSSPVARTRENSSSLHGFMYLSSRMFDADVQFVAQAGWSLITTASKAISSVIDYTGITPTNSVAGAQQTAVWDSQRWIPDVILLHIGGNDTPRSNFSASVYKQAVKDIINKLHGYYPEAKMLWVHSGTKCGAYAMDALTEEGILSQGYINECQIPQIGSDGWGAGEHASLKTHITASENIASCLEQKYGMERSQRNITFEEFESVLMK